MKMLPKTTGITYTIIDDNFAELECRIDNLNRRLEALESQEPEQETPINEWAGHTDADLFDNAKIVSNWKHYPNLRAEILRRLESK